MLNLARFCVVLMVSIDRPSRYDARLFNQSSGMDSGFGPEDGYGVYSKPMFNRGEAQSLYRPKTDDGDAWGDADQQVRVSLRHPWTWISRSPI